VSTVAFGDTGMQTGYESVGRTVGFELFDRYEVDDIARTAAQRAITKLAARPAPSGTLPVVIGPGGGGVLFHEACGHGLEKDLVDKGASVFKDKLGQQVASPLVTLVDDGTMAEEWGCFAIDDEGTPAQRNVLIQDGVLTDYMWDMQFNQFVVDMVVAKQGTISPKWEQTGEPAPPGLGRGLKRIRTSRRRSAEGGDPGATASTGPAASGEARPRARQRQAGSTSGATEVDDVETLDPEALAAQLKAAASEPDLPWGK